MHCGFHIFQIKTGEVETSFSTILLAFLNSFPFKDNTPWKLGISISWKMNAYIVNSIQGIEGQLAIFKRLGVNYSFRLFYIFLHKNYNIKSIYNVWLFKWMIYFKFVSLIMLYKFKILQKNILMIKLVEWVFKSH